MCQLLSKNGFSACLLLSLVLVLLSRKLVRLTEQCYEYNSNAGEQLEPTKS